MNEPISIYIPDNRLRSAVSHAAHFLNFSAVMHDQGPEAGDIILESGAPLRLGAVMDWLIIRASVQHQASIQTPILLTVGEVHIHDRVFMGPDELSTRLTDREIDMIRALYNAPDQIMPKAQLLDQVWGYAAGAETHTIETHIYRLRQKIERDPSMPENIVTTDVGYRLVLKNKDQIL